jgi:hypothetical protein
MRLNGIESVTFIKFSRTGLLSHLMELFRYVRKRPTHLKEFTK